MSEFPGLDFGHFERFVALPEVQAEMAAQHERMIADMREACRMVHVDELEPEPASISARKAEREAWIADLAALRAEMGTVA